MRTVTVLALVVGIALLAASVGLGARDRSAKRHATDEALTNKASDEAAQLEEYFARARGDRRQPLCSGVSRPITASFGVAAIPDGAAEPTLLLRAADRALYLAKARGRNRVETVAETDPEPVTLTVA